MTDPTGSQLPPRVGGVGRLLRVRAGWILAVAAAATLTAAALSMLQTPVYRSTAQVMVGAEFTPGGAPPHEPSMGTEKELAASPAVAELASRTLKVPVADLLSGLAIAVPVDTNVLSISYSSGSPADAQRRAQGMALAYVNYKRSPPFRSLPEQAAIIGPAGLPDRPVSPNTPLNVGVGLAVGLVLGFLVALVRDRLDDRVRGPAELEHRLLPVLEVVPAAEGPAAATAVAAAAPALGIAVLGDDEVKTPAGYDVAFRSIDAPGASGRANLEGGGSGTTLHLWVKGLPRDKDAVYEVLCDAEAWTASAGTFRTDADGHAYVVLTTALRKNEYNAIRIVRRSHAPDGRLVRRDVLAAKLS